MKKIDFVFKILFDQLKHTDENSQTILQECS